MTALNPQAPGKHHEDHRTAVPTRQGLTKVTERPGAAGKSGDCGSSQNGGLPRAGETWHPRGTGCRSLQQRQTDVRSHEAQGQPPAGLLCSCARASGRRGHSNVEQGVPQGLRLRRRRAWPQTHSLTDTRENQVPPAAPSTRDDAVGGPATPEGTSRIRDRAGALSAQTYTGRPTGRTDGRTKGHRTHLSITCSRQWR